ncbi:hypothetical protein N0V88_001134 [Collariella sp. IMI 366227]|nr:hypothetical protein N0V88_001134 [Collariella sp. IMI 366227]
MAFIQDPRLRQRWNRLSHTTEAVTSDAAAGIWTFGHRYVTPCLGSLVTAADSCTSVCLGDREERARRARERDRGARRVRSGVEHSFDFYDDWEADLAFEEEFVAGLGDERVAEKKEGMSYGTRSTGGLRRKASGEEDPNVIPRTAPLGFLGRLPFKIVGSLRYKPSAANLRDHPGGGGLAHEFHVEGEEYQPLLAAGEEEDAVRRQRRSPQQGKRARSDTTTSDNTSSSYRSRGDLFPSDGEGDEDAVPLDDEFTVALERVDDRSSNKTRSTKGKRPANRDRDRLSRTVSRATLLSTTSEDESKYGSSNPMSPSHVEEAVPVPSLEDLQREEERIEREEHEEIERRRRAASQLAMQRGLSNDDQQSAETVDKANQDPENAGLEPQAVEESVPKPNGTAMGIQELGEADEPKPPPTTLPERSLLSETKTMNGELPTESTFVPARLPHFN